MLCYLGIFYAQALARPFLRATTPLKRDKENRGSQSRLRQYYGSNKTASNRMLRGRSLQGLGGAVYLLVRSRSFVRRYKVVDAFNWGPGDVGFYIVSIRIIQLNRGIQQLSTMKGATVSGFQDLTILYKNFSLPPQHFNHHHGLLPAAVRRLYVGSAESKDQQVRRPYHVQVQSPISITKPLYITEPYREYYSRFINRLGI